MRNDLWRCALIASTLFCALAPRAAASESAEALDCPSRPENKAKARKLAGALFSDATAAFDDGRFKDALKLFLCSMRIIEHENTLTNIEKTILEVEDDEEALALLDAYIGEMTDRDMTPKIRELADDMRRSAEPEGSQEEIHHEAPPPNSFADAPLEPEPESSPAAPESPCKNTKILAVSAWTNVGVAAATFIGAIVMQGLSASSRNKAKEATTYKEFMDEKEKSRALQVGAASTFAASAVFAGMGIAQLLLMDGGEEDARKHPLALSVATGAGWLGLKGDF